MYIRNCDSDTGCMPQGQGVRGSRLTAQSPHAKATKLLGVWDEISLCSGHLHLFCFLAV